MASAPHSSLRAEPAPSARVIAFDPLEMRGLMLQDAARVEHDVRTLRGRPLLVTIWHSRSELSRDNLESLADHYDDLVGMGLQLIGVCGDPSTAGAYLAQVDPPFVTGTASRGSFRRLFVLRRALLRGPEHEITLPISFLLDADHRVRICYSGALDMAQLQRDVAALTAGRAPEPELPGRWLERPRCPRDRVARWFAEVQLIDDARALILQDADEARRR